MKTGLLKKMTTVLLITAVASTSCKKDEDNKENKGSEVSYPYTEHEIEYWGFKSGLTASSSDQAFSDGLDEIIQTYIANHPNSSNEVTFDNVTYEFTNLQNVTSGGIPNSIWDDFWADLDEYDYSIGSCYAFVHVQIPSKGGTGTVYVLYTIINDDMNASVWYMAVKGNITPIDKKSGYSYDSPNRFGVDFQKNSVLTHQKYRATVR